MNAKVFHLSFLFFSAFFFFPSGAKAYDVREISFDRGRMKALLSPEHSNPIIAVSLAFKTGSADDPPHLQGLSHLVSSLMTEGAGRNSAYYFTELLAENAISLSYSADRDYFYITLQTLSDRKELAFSLLKDTLTRPRFDHLSINQAKERAAASLKARESDPVSVAFELWNKEAFGSHPYARPETGTLQGISNVSKYALKRFVRTRFAKDNLTVSVCGDITPDALSRLLDATFSKLPEEADISKVPPAVPEKSGTAVGKLPAPQSAIVFGKKGIDRKHPDFFALYILNHILGGSSLNSRLMMDLREKRGYVYGVSSFLYPSVSAPLMLGYAATGNDKAAETIKLIKAEWKKMKEKGLSARELDQAKRHITGAFPLSLTSNSDIASFLTVIQTNNLGIDYLQKRNDYMNSVTPAQIKRVASEYFDPAALLFTVGGDPSNISTSLETLKENP